MTGDTGGEIAIRPPAWAVVLLVLLVGGLVFVAYGPYFRVARATVLGTDLIRETDVLGLGQVNGVSIVVLDVVSLEAALSALPRIKSVAVERRLPDELVIRVTERQPWAIWQTRAGAYSIDNEGYVLGAAASDGRWLRIEDSTGGELKVGARVDPLPARFAGQLVTRLSAAAGPRPARFEFASGTGLTVLMDEGWRARFGDPTDLDYKLASLRAVLDQARRDGASPSLIDLRYRDRPYYRSRLSDR